MFNTAMVDKATLSHRQGTKRGYSVPSKVVVGGRFLLPSVNRTLHSTYEEEEGIPSKNDSISHRFEILPMRIILFSKETQKSVVQVSAISRLEKLIHNPRTISRRVV